MKRRTIIVIVLVAVSVIAVSLMHMPEQIKGTMTVSTITGETAELDIDLLYFSNLLLPSYVKGTLSVGGIAYIDQYIMLKNFPSVSDNHLFPFDWWKIRASTPYNMTFLRFDCTDIISAQTNRIDVLDIVLNKGVCKIHYVYTDESNQNGTEVVGVSFWGPAKNAEEATQIAKSFGYEIPQQG